MGRSAHRLELALNQAAAREECREARGGAGDGELWGTGCSTIRCTSTGGQAQGLLARFDHEVDFARLDGMIAADMAKGGRFTLNDIERGFREGSLQVFILIPIYETYKSLVS